MGPFYLLAFALAAGLAIHAPGILLADIEDELKGLERSGVNAVPEHRYSATFYTQAPGGNKTMLATANGATLQLAMGNIKVKAKFRMTAFLALQSKLKTSKSFSGTITDCQKTYGQFGSSPKADLLVWTKHPPAMAAQRLYFLEFHSLSEEEKVVVRLLNEVKAAMRQKGYAQELEGLTAHYLLWEQPVEEQANILNTVLLDIQTTWKTESEVEDLLGEVKQSFSEEQFNEVQTVLEGRDTHDQGKILVEVLALKDQDLQVRKENLLALIKSEEVEELFEKVKAALRQKEYEEEEVTQELEGIMAHYLLWEKTVEEQANILKTLILDIQTTWKTESEVEDLIGEVKQSFSEEFNEVQTVLEGKDTHDQGKILVKVLALKDQELPERKENLLTLIKSEEVEELLEEVKQHLSEEQIVELQALLEDKDLHDRGEILAKALAATESATNDI